MCLEQHWVPNTCHGSIPYYIYWRLLTCTHIYAYATSQSANLYIVPGPLVAAGDRTMTKAGKDPLSGAALPMREADETHLSV